MDYSESCKQMGYAILEKANEERTRRFYDAIHHIAEKMTEEQSQMCQRVVKNFEEAAEKSDPGPYARKFMDIMNKWRQREFDKDMIYYSVCYDRFRI